MSDFEIAAVMQAYGGSFTSLLGKLWQLGDDANRARLKAAFSDYWEQYRELGELKRSNEVTQ
jgi:hypothetical protein